MVTIQFDVFDLFFIFFIAMSQTISVISRRGRAICYMYQTSGICADMCRCNHMHQMEKTEVGAVDSLAKAYIMISIIQTDIT